MSKIPYTFEMPVPKYFRENGYMKNPKNCAFLSWCFSRCWKEERNVLHNSQLINLKPYQFIFGRLICSEETGLTEDEVRTQQKRWEILKLLRKTPNKTPNQFTVYEWVWTNILINEPQPKPQETPNESPTNPQPKPHNTDIECKNNISKKVLSKQTNIHVISESDVVVKKIILNSRGIEVESLESVYQHAVLSKKDWKKEEIEEAYKKIQDYNKPITNTFSLMEVIITKNRNVESRKNQCYKKTKIQRSNNSYVDNSGIEFLQGTKEHPLEKFLCQTGLRKK